LTVITGMSGAGKSQAMSAFEDDGWFCIDNIPPRMIPALVEISELEGSRLEKVAVVCDVRGGHLFSELIRILDAVEARDDVNLRVIYLEASVETLLTRFRETRRRHPLSEGGGVLDGINLERELLEPLRGRAHIVIDSSAMNIWDLRRVLGERTGVVSARSRMAPIFVSFGFKHGLPRDVDLVFDVRFLDNPFYEPGLGELTGLDDPVIRFLEQVEGWEEFIERLTGLMDFLMPAYAREGKRHLVVGFGCTGGRHRSVRLAEMMTERYRMQGYEATVDHRHLTRSTHGHSDTGPPDRSHPDADR